MCRPEPAHTQVRPYRAFPERSLDEVEANPGNPNSGFAIEVRTEGIYLFYVLTQDNSGSKDSLDSKA
jgi:hypothetical protein